MHVLDTCVIVDFLRGNALAINKIQKLIDTNQQIAITTLTVCELYKGVYLSSRSAIEEAKLDSFISTIEVISLDIASSKLYGKYHYLMQKAGNKTQEIDLLIGCISIIANATFVTCNIKHYNKIPNIKLVSY